MKIRDTLRLLVAFSIGCVFGLLSLVMIYLPDRIGAVAILLFPGAVLAMVVSGNAHVFHTWIVVLGNIGFYFVLSYVVWRLLDMHSSKPTCH